MVFRRLCSCGIMIEAPSYNELKTKQAEHAKVCHGEVPLF